MASPEEEPHFCANNIVAGFPDEPKACSKISCRTGSHIWYSNLSSRAKPIKDATAKGYQSYVDSWLIPQLGSLRFAEVNNKQGKALIEKLSSQGKSSKLIWEAIQVLKQVVASIVDENGEQIYPRQWNHDFIDLPVVNGHKQLRPVFSPEQVQQIINQSCGRYRVLYALLAGTGLRIGEALAIELGEQSDHATTLSKDCRTLYVRKSVWEGQEQDPETENAVRDVDICESLAAMLRDYIGDRETGLLFQSDSGLPLFPGNISRDSLDKILFGQKIYNGKGKLVKGIPGIFPQEKNGYGFHSFRRFRVTHLRALGTPEDILRFWTGHADKSITDRFSQMKLRTELRREWTEKVGLGFELPVNPAEGETTA